MDKRREISALIMTQTKSNERFRAATIKSSYSSLIAYFVAVIFYGGVISFLELAAAGYLDFIFLFLYCCLFTLAVIFWAKRTPAFHYRQGYTVAILLGVNWFISFSVWLLMLGDARPGALFFSLIMIIYFYGFNSLIIAVLGNLAIVSLYIGASFVSLEWLDQKNNLINDLYLILAFLPASFALYKVGGALSKQRKKLKSLTKSQKAAHEELHKALTKLQKVATTDSLTGLANHREASSQLNFEVSRISRFPQDLSILTVDVDHFKQINDTLGHDGGDYVLVEMAKLMQQQFRETDIVARWGGEEFLIVMPNTSLSMAQKLSEQFLDLIREHPFKYGGQLLKITVSGGVAQFESSFGIDGMLKEADDKLYRAKENGRDQIV